MEIKWLSLIINFLFVIAARNNRFWEKIPVEIAILALILYFLIYLFILTVLLYIAGLIVVGGRKAKFTDALAVSALGTFLGSFVWAFFNLLIPIPPLGLVAYFIFWLGLIKHFFDTGWLGALAIAILAVIISIALFVILAIILAIAISIGELIRWLFGVQP